MKFVTESVYNTHRFLRANSNVLWDDKLASYIPGDNK